MQAGDEGLAPKEHWATYVPGRAVSCEFEQDANSNKEQMNASDFECWKDGNALA